MLEFSILKFSHISFKESLVSKYVSSFLIVIPSLIILFFKSLISVIYDEFGKFFWLISNFGKLKVAVITHGISIFFRCNCIMVSIF